MCKKVYLHTAGAIPPKSRSTATAAHLGNPCSAGRIIMRKDENPTSHPHTQKTCPLVPFREIRCPTNSLQTTIQKQNYQLTSPATDHSPQSPTPDPQPPNIPCRKRPPTMLRSIYLTNTRGPGQRPRQKSLPQRTLFDNLNPQRPQPSATPARMVWPSALRPQSLTPDPQPPS